ncbi:MAG: hypothetical protein ACPIA2_06690 [Mariniblastus sp.]
MTNTSHVEERIDHLVKELAGKRRITSLGTNLSLLVGLISIALLCVYFGYGYFMLDELTKPETVVGSAKAYLEDNSPQAMEIAAAEVRNSAPIWANQASQEFIASMPTVREQAEVALMSYIDEQLAETQKLTSEGFEDMMDKHQADFADAINMMVAGGDSAVFTEKVMPLIEEAYAPEMKESVLNTLGILQEINRRMEKLATGKDLNEIELQQRKILGLTRLLRD